MNGIAAVEKLPIDEEYFEKEYKERLNRPGPINFTAMLVNDSYKGLDQSQKCQVMVIERSQKRIEYKYKKVDVRACEERAIFLKSRLEVFETDDENQDADDYIEEDDLSELQRILKKSGLTEAGNKLMREAKEYKERVPFDSPNTPYLPEKSRKIFKLLQLEKRRKDAHKKR